MPNIFDSLEARIHRATTRRFGYDVSWLSSQGDQQAAPIIARAHVKDPNKYGTRNEHLKVDYGAQQPILEYYQGDFPGLRHAVLNGGEETIKVKKFTDTWETAIIYRVVDCNKIHDGDTFAATLVLISDPNEE